MILKVRSDLEGQLEGKLEVYLAVRGAQEAPSCAWSATWTTKLRPRDSKLRLECGLESQVAPKRLQVALGVWLGGAMLRLECGLEAQVEPKRRPRAPS